MTNNMDIILILMDSETITLLFIPEQDNDVLINKIESIIFKPDKNVILTRVKI
jgi:hypothetical protein